MIAGRSEAAAAIVEEQLEDASRRVEAKLLTMRFGSKMASE